MSEQINNLEETHKEERKARCFYYGKKFTPPYTYHGCECETCIKTSEDGKCHCERSSSDRERLAFFRSLPEKEFDEFYCGCMSWE